MTISGKFAIVDVEITKIDDAMVHGRLSLSSVNGDKVAGVFDATICK